MTAGILMSPKVRGPQVIQQRVNFYRLHFISRKTGTIGHTFEFHADDDAAAVAFAAVWAEDAPMELWGSNGRVKRWGPSKDKG